MTEKHEKYQRLIDFCIRIYGIRRSLHAAHGGQSKSAFSPQRQALSCLHFVRVGRHGASILFIGDESVELPLDCNV